MTPKESKVIKLVTGDVSVPAKSGQRFPSAHESYSLEVDSSTNVITITGRCLPLPIINDEIRNPSFI